jgi:hypothetical protein
MTVTSSIRKLSLRRVHASACKMEVMVTSNLPLRQWIEVPDPGPPSTISVSEPCAAPKTRRHQDQPEEFLQASIVAVRLATEIAQERVAWPYCRQTAENLQNLHIFLHTFTVTQRNSFRYNSLQ